SGRETSARSQYRKTGNEKREACAPPAPPLDLRAVASVLVVPAVPMLVAFRVDAPHEQQRPPVSVEVRAPHDHDRGGIVCERPANHDDAVHERPRNAEPDCDAHSRLRRCRRGAEGERQRDCPDHVFHRSPPWLGLHWKGRATAGAGVLTATVNRGWGSWRRGAVGPRRVPCRGRRRARFTATAARPAASGAALLPARRVGPAPFWKRCGVHPPPPRTRRPTTGSA